MAFFTDWEFLDLQVAAPPISFPWTRDFRLCRPPLVKLGVSTPLPLSVYGHRLPLTLPGGDLGRPPADFLTLGTVRRGKYPTSALGFFSFSLEVFLHDPPPFRPLPPFPFSLLLAPRVDPEARVCGQFESAFPCFALCHRHFRHNVVFSARVRRFRNRLFAQVFFPLPSVSRFIPQSLPRFV